MSEEGVKKEKVLIYIGNPNIDKSFNHKLVFVAREYLVENGFEVRIVDLYKIKFEASGGACDFDNLLNNKSFDYQVEQKHAVTHKTFSKEVQEQIDNVLWCDVIMFQFPFWWFSYPACIKGFFDRVFVANVAWGSKNLSPRKTFWSCTTGSPHKDDGGRYDFELMEKFFYNLTITCAYTGLEKLEPYYVFGLNFARLTQGEEGPVFERPNSGDYNKWIEGMKIHLKKILNIEEKT